MPRQIDEARLFQAVVELWLEEGYAGTTTKGIANQAKVNEATLFRRYGGKAGLFVAALRHQLERVPLRGLTPTDDVVADLTRVVEAYLETQQQVGAFFPLLLVEVTRHPALRPALDAAQINIGALLGIVVHHQQRGALAPGDPQSTMTALIGPLFVVGLFRGAVPDAAGSIDAEAHVARFLHGHAPPPPLSS